MCVYNSRQLNINKCITMTIRFRRTMKLAFLKKMSIFLTTARYGNSVNVFLESIVFLFAIHSENTFLMIGFQSSIKNAQNGLVFCKFLFKQICFSLSMQHQQQQQ